MEPCVNEVNVYLENEYAFFSLVFKSLNNKIMPTTITNNNIWLKKVKFFQKIALSIIQAINPEIPLVKVSIPIIPPHFTRLISFSF